LPVSPPHKKDSFPDSLTDILRPHTLSLNTGHWRVDDDETDLPYPSMLTASVHPDCPYLGNTVQTSGVVNIGVYIADDCRVWLVIQHKYIVSMRSVRSALCRPCSPMHQLSPCHHMQQPMFSAMRSVRCSLSHM
jgi:hypothetical protein